MISRFRNLVISLLEYVSPRPTLVPDDSGPIGSVVFEVIGAPAVNTRQPHGWN